MIKDGFTLYSGLTPTLRVAAGAGYSHWVSSVAYLRLWECSRYVVREGAGIASSQLRVPRIRMLADSDTSQLLGHNTAIG
jgi:hypothetical protein